MKEKKSGIGAWDVFRRGCFLGGHKKSCDCLRHTKYWDLFWHNQNIVFVLGIPNIGMFEDIMNLRICSDINNRLRNHTTCYALKDPNSLFLYTLYVMRRLCIEQYIEYRCVYIYRYVRMI